MARCGSINLQHNGIFAHFLMEAFIPWELRLPRYWSPKLWGQEAEIQIRSRNQWIIVKELLCSCFYLLISRLVNPGYGRNNTIYQSLIQSVLEDIAPALQGVASQLVLLLNLQKTFHFVTQQLQDDGENDKISEFPKHESIVLFTVK